MTQPDAAAPYSGASAPAGTTALGARPSRALGIWSLVLGVLVVAGGVVAIVVLVQAAQTLSVDINTGLQNLFSAFVIAVVMMIGGFIAAIVSLILGIMSISRKSGRVYGVIGIVLSVLVAFGWIIAIIFAAVTGAGLNTFAQWV